MRLRTIIGLLALFLWSAAAVSAQDINDTARSLYKVANYAAQVAKPGLAASNNITWEILRVTRLSSMTCPLVQGTDLGREVRPYIMTLHYPDAKYVVYVAEDGTLAQPCDPKFDSLTAVIPPTPTPLPTLTTTLTPTITLTPAPTATALPAAVTCPPDFNGFMTPRIVPGTATARVGDGGSPNRLRDQPSVSGTQIGQIQPGRTINQVLGSPACSDTYVWWLVEMDGIQGWTVESDSSDGGSYFLEPLQGVPLPTHMPNAAPAVATSEPTRTSDSAVTIGEVPGVLHTVSVDRPVLVEGFRFLSENTLVRQSSDELYIWTLTDGAQPALQILKGIEAFDDTQDALYWLPPSRDRLVTAKKSSLTETTTIPVEALNKNVRDLWLSMSRDGRYFLTSGCNDTDCAQGTIEVWETASGKRLRSQPAHSGNPFVMFTPDDKRILSMTRVSGDGIQIWDTQSGQFLGGVALTTTVNQSTYPVISSDSAYFYIASCIEPANDFECGQDKLQLRGWSIETSEQVTMAVLPIPTLDQGLYNTVYSLAISRDGLQLAVGFGDASIQFWSVDPVTRAFIQGETLTIAGTVGGEGFDPLITALAFNADGTHIAVGTASGVVQIHEVPSL